MAAIYGVTIKGRNKRVLVRADSQAAARDLFVTAKALTSAEMQDAIENGEGVWKPETELPADEPASEAEQPPAAQDDADAD